MVKNLAGLLECLETISVTGDTNIEISEIVNDSRKVTENCLFFCISGMVKTSVN